MSAEQHALVSRVVAANPVIGELGERFTAAGFELSLVGGSVRGAKASGLALMLGRRF